MSNQKIIDAVTIVISSARISTYESATGGKKPDSLEALNLYAWNADVSGALLIPLHVCEVAIRNAVSTAIENVYGDRWPWSSGFERSLPNPTRGFSPKKDLINARLNQRTTGKVIPELKFAFWQSIFTSRHDQRFWNPYLTDLFPNMNIWTLMIQILGVLGFWDGRYVAHLWRYDYEIERYGRNGF